MSDVPIWALSLRQPWAYAVLSMGKDIENRTWEPPLHIVGNRIWIHASKGLGRVAERLDPVQLLPPLSLDTPLPTLEQLPLGAIVGHVRVAGFVRASSSRWFIGPVGWQLEDPKTIEPIVCRGMLGMWFPQQELAAKLARALEAA